MGTQLDLFAAMTAPRPTAAAYAALEAPAPAAPLEPPADPVALLRGLRDAQRALSEAMAAAAPLDEQARLEAAAVDLRRRHVVAFEALPDRDAVARALADALGHKPHPDMLSAYDDLRRAAQVRGRT